MLQGGVAQSLVMLQGRVATSLAMLQEKVGAHHGGRVGAGNAQTAQRGDLGLEHVPPEVDAQVWYVRLAHHLMPRAWQPGQY